jgi:holin-like protein
LPKERAPWGGDSAASSIDSLFFAPYNEQYHAKKGKIMKYVKQFGIILLVSLVGELLNFLLPLPVPASIYGLVLMFLCLVTGLIKLDDVHDTACFLIEIMPIMFIPPAVGLMASWDVIRANLLAYIVIAVVTTVVVMSVSGLVTQAVLKKGKKGAEHE